MSDPRGVQGLDELDQIYRWTELIQSSPLAVERSVHGAIGGAYRSQRITTLELRFNPMKRNRGGEQDLDHIIAAAVRGMDRATLEYPVKPGLIFCLDRTFPYELNEIIAEKAILWRDRGVVGVERLQRVDELVGLLHEVAHEAAVGLLLIPRALLAQGARQLVEAHQLGTGAARTAPVALAAPGIPAQGRDDGKCAVAGGVIAPPSCSTARR